MSTYEFPSCRHVIFDYLDIFPAWSLAEADAVSGAGA